MRQLYNKEHDDEDNDDEDDDDCIACKFLKAEMALFEL